MNHCSKKVGSVSITVGNYEPKTVVEEKLASSMRFDNTIHGSGQDLVTGVGIHVNHLIVHTIDVPRRELRWSLCNFS